MAFDTIVLQQAVDPKSVKTRFLYYDDRNDLAFANLRLFRELRKRARSLATSPLRTVCFDIFSPPPGDNDVISQVDRLSSNETKIAPRSVRIAVAA